MNARRAGQKLLLEVAALDGEERPVRVVGVLFEEAGEHLEVTGPAVLCVELAWRALGVR